MSPNPHSGSLYSDGRDRGGNDRGHNVKSRGRLATEMRLKLRGAALQRLVPNVEEAAHRSLPAGRRLYATRTAFAASTSHVFSLLACVKEFLLCRLGAGRSYLIDNPSHAEPLKHLSTRTAKTDVWGAPVA